MRWRFFEPNNKEELAARHDAIERIDAWWEEFQRNTDRLDAYFKRKARWDLPEWMHQHLHVIHPNLMWEFGPARDGPGHRLVVTSETRQHLRPLVAEILHRAPAIPGWEFYPHRPPLSLAASLSIVKVRSGRDASDFSVAPTCGEHRLVDLHFTAPSCTTRDDKKARRAAIVATESLLGEACLDQWIGVIEAGPLEPAPDGKTARPIPLERLKDTVDALIGSQIEQLPDAPYHAWAPKALWTLWKLKPKTRDDYPRQSDLFIAKSINPELWKALPGPRPFFSTRFSRFGETFCYVKLDGSQGLDEEKFKDKSEIEHAIDEVLGPEGLGCHIGGGTGLRYSYVDLALTDVERGMQAVRKRLREGNVPRRSWIQFFDADLEAEWVGIYDDTPPPPMDLRDD